MFKAVLAAAAAAAFFAASCSSTGTSAKQASGSPVAVVDAAIPKAVEKAVKSAPGSIQVLKPTGFKEVRDNLGEVFNAIVGNKDTEINPKDVKVTFPDGISFRETVADRTDVTSWIINLPSGLTANIHEALSGKKEFLMLVSGTPGETRKEPIQVTVPGSFLTSGTDLTIQANANALIDIADAVIEIGDIDPSSIENAPAAWSKNAGTVIIGGSVGSAIVPKTITVKFDHAALAFAIPVGTNLSSWITNLPTGLQALSSAAEKDADEIKLTISGIPQAAIDQAVFVKVPAENLHRALDLVVKPNDDLRFEILGLSISNVLIGGAINTEILPKTFSVYFGAAKLLNNIDKDTDLSRWFGNLPSGLRAVADEAAAAGSSSLSVKVTGTPSIYINEPIRISVPRNIIYADRGFDVAKNDNARFDVGSFESEILKYITEQTLDENGVKTNAWQLKSPKLVEVKDFEAVGIIQITAQSVEEIGPDGAYHWNGEGITYSKLLAEARKLNAHAIINVVIDYRDDITNTIERRHVVDGYKFSPVEQAYLKLDKNRLTLETQDDGSLVLVEQTHRTVRTYSGNALAIRYRNTDIPPASK
ncbi:MAG: hypothetical protein LBG26_08350 [Treponema sp.]|nr:hypothetical protein [Treponema sp.]